MSASNALRQAVVQAVKESAPLLDQITTIFDDVPKNPWGAKEAYITFGPEDGIKRGGENGCTPLDDISLQLDIWVRGGGARAKCLVIADLVLDAVSDLDPVGFSIVSMSDPAVQVMRDPDGLTTHGIVRAEWVLEKVPQEDPQG